MTPIGRGTPPGCFLGQSPIPHHLREPPPQITFPPWPPWQAHAKKKYILIRRIKKSAGKQILQKSKCKQKKNSPPSGRRVLTPPPAEFLSFPSKPGNRGSLPSPSGPGLWSHTGPVTTNGPGTDADAQPGGGRPGPPRLLRRRPEVPGARSPAVHSGDWGGIAIPQKNTEGASYVFKNSQRACLSLSSGNCVYPAPALFPNPFRHPFTRSNSEFFPPQGGQPP